METRDPSSHFLKKFILIHNPSAGSPTPTLKFGLDCSRGRDRGRDRGFDGDCDANAGSADADATATATAAAAAEALVRQSPWQPVSRALLVVVDGFVSLPPPAACRPPPLLGQLNLTVKKKVKTKDCEARTELEIKDLLGSQCGIDRLYGSPVPIAGAVSSANESRVLRC